MSTIAAPKTTVSNRPQISNFDPGTALEDLRADAVDIEARARHSGSRTRRSPRSPPTSTLVARPEASDAPSEALRPIELGKLEPSIRFAWSSPRSRRAI